MGKKKFDFDNGKHIIWTWKGDYLDLGAGDEVAIYTEDDVIHGQYDVDKSDALYMTLAETIGSKTVFNWNPG
ncbi:hypothetical protein [Ethanoligenens sp.]|uniref:hypothetical protein n=1 Tax=Ethanoligenens sp. TaxID=2099655 RepID=UPI0039EAB7B3